MSETRKNYIASLIFFLIGAGVLVSSLYIKDPGLSEMGPREFPQFIGICMVALSLALFFKTACIGYKQKQEGGPNQAACGGEEKASVKADEFRAFAIAVICLLYAAVFTVFGYFVSTFIAITLICILFREKRIWVYPLLFGVAVVIWLGFTYLLSIRLP